jgi:hypothetical protein
MNALESKQLLQQEKTGDEATDASCYNLDEVVDSGSERT